MSITRSYNKNTGINYAYDTTYVWDDELQKKVQKKRCIGQFDKKTGEVVPNRKRGRPRKEVTTPVVQEEEKPAIQKNSASIAKTMEDISSRLGEIEESYHSLEKAVTALGKDLARLKEQTV